MNTFNQVSADWSITAVVVMLILCITYLIALHMKLSSEESKKFWSNKLEDDNNGDSN